MQPYVPESFDICARNEAEELMMAMMERPVDGFAESASILMADGKLEKEAIWAELEVVFSSPQNARLDFAVWAPAYFYILIVYVSLLIDDGFI